LALFVAVAAAQKGVSGPKATVYTYEKGTVHRHGPGLVPAVPAAIKTEERVEADIAGRPKRTPNGLAKGDRSNFRAPVYADAAGKRKRTLRPKMIRRRRAPSPKGKTVKAAVAPKPALAPPFSVGGVKGEAPKHKHHFNGARVHIHQGDHWTIRPPASDQLKDIARAVDEHLRSPPVDPKPPAKGKKAKKSKKSKKAKKGKGKRKGKGKGRGKGKRSAKKVSKKLKKLTRKLSKLKAKAANAIKKFA